MKKRMNFFFNHSSSIIASIIQRASASTPPFGRWDRKENASHLTVSQKLEAAKSLRIPFCVSISFTVQEVLASLNFSSHKFNNRG
jgi:hypothetical protein